MKVKKSKIESGDFLIVFPNYEVSATHRPQYLDSMKDEAINDKIRVFKFSKGRYFELNNKKVWSIVKKYNIFFDKNK